MHSSAVALRSPAVMSMSISRPGRTLDTSPASRISSSVSLPMALTTTTTSSPRRLVRATWSATSRMRSGSATDVPPNFWTTSDTAVDATAGLRRLTNRLGPARRPARPTRSSCSRVVGLVGAQERADRPQVVAPDRQDAAVVVAALEDDRPQVAQHRLGLGHRSGGRRGRARAGPGPRPPSPSVLLAEQHAHRHVVERRPGRAGAAGSGCGSPARRRPTAEALQRPPDSRSTSSSDRPRIRRTERRRCPPRSRSWARWRPSPSAVMRSPSAMARSLLNGRRAGWPAAIAGPARQAVLMIRGMAPDRPACAGRPTRRRVEGPHYCSPPCRARSDSARTRAGCMRLEEQRTATQKVQRKRQARTLGLIIGGGRGRGRRHRHLQRRRRRRRRTRPTDRHHRHHQPTAPSCCPATGAPSPARRRARPPTASAERTTTFEQAPPMLHRPRRRPTPPPSRPPRATSSSSSTPTSAPEDREQLRGAVPLPLLRRRAVPPDHPRLRRTRPATPSGPRRAPAAPATRSRTSCRPTGHRLRRRARSPWPTAGRTATAASSSSSPASRASTCRPTTPLFGKVDRGHGRRARHRGHAAPRTGRPPITSATIASSRSRCSARADAPPVRVKAEAEPAPPPGASSHQISPPIASTAPARDVEAEPHALLRPRAVVAADRVNSSKIRSRSPAATPGPRSAHRRDHPVAVERRPHRRWVTRPAST